MKFTSLTLLAGALALAFTPAASAADIVDTAVAGNFQTLVTAVKAADLVETLKGPGPFTARIGRSAPARGIGGNLLRIERSWRSAGRERDCADSQR